MATPSTITHGTTPTTPPVSSEYHFFVRVENRVLRLYHHRNSKKVVNTNHLIIKSNYYKRKARNLILLFTSKLYYVSRIYATILLAGYFVPNRF